MKERDMIFPGASVLSMLLTATKRVRLSWILFEISILGLMIAVLLIVSVYKNSFKEKINLGVIFLLIPFFVVASLALRRIKNIPARKSVCSDNLLSTVQNLGVMKEKE